MAVPWFHLKDIAKRHGIIALSSNYMLYADISNRVMRLLSQCSPHQEVYSIDESFLDLTGMADLTRYAQAIRSTFKQCVGIPVCVGIAPSKTLAKLANHVAKKQKCYDSVCDFNAMSAQELDTDLALREQGVQFLGGHRSDMLLQGLR